LKKGEKIGPILSAPDLKIDLNFEKKKLAQLLNVTASYCPQSPVGYSNA
jgi:hypothetical protein